jgi:HSP20 family protein
MAIPGAKSEDIDISVTGDVVTVTGEVHREKRSEKTQPYVEEIWRGRFQRAFQLPVPVDPNKAEATFEHGLLKLVLPKSEATRPRKIQVRGQQGTIGSNQESSDGKAKEVAVGER